MKRLAIAVPTYNRSKDIDCFIRHGSFVFDNEDVDLLICDSSESNETEEVVRRYAEDGAQNLIYCMYPSQMPSNVKFYRIYKDLSDRYDYIWMIHDHTVFSIEAFRYIYNNLSLCPDFIYLKIHTPPSVKTCSAIKEIDLNNFLYNSAWFLGKIGAAIVSSQSVLGDIDWAYYDRKYLSRRRINFSHVGLYFERIAKIDDPKVYTFTFPREFFEDTRKYKALAWDRDRVRIATEGWGEVITSLPDIYTNKEAVLKTADRYIITKHILVDLKEKGIYSPVVFVKYSTWIRRVFPEIYDDAKKIAFLSRKRARKLYVDPIIENIKKALSEDRRVYIYGAGIHAYECLKLIKRYGIEPEGFVVSDIAGNPEYIDVYPVIALETMTGRDRKTFLVLAVMNIYWRDIINSIEKANKSGADIEYRYY